MKPDIHIKRVYESPKRGEGFRVLVDRIWPRGIRKDDLHVDMWAKEIAPSTELRQWFGHDPKRWAEFRQRYEAELRDRAIAQRIRHIVDAAHDRPVITLLYSAKDTEHNQAVVLKGVIERTLARGHRTAAKANGHGRASKQTA
jgi:uncharacterized protein YeaO (DUF488 family)